MRLTKLRLEEGAVRSVQLRGRGFFCPPPLLPTPDAPTGALVASVSDSYSLNPDPAENFNPDPNGP